MKPRSKTPRAKLSKCGVKLKKCHPSWGRFLFCPKCGETDSVCSKGGGTHGR